MRWRFSPAGRSTERKREGCLDMKETQFSAGGWRQGRSVVWLFRLTWEPVLIEGLREREAGDKVGLRVRGGKKMDPKT